MSIQLIGKRLMTNQVPLSFHRLSVPSYLLPQLAFYPKSHKKIVNFCTEIADPSTTSDRSVATEFFINKCGLTNGEITKAFRHDSRYLRAKSPSQNMEEVLELLKGYGLTTPAQFRNVVLGNPRFFFLSAERNLKPKLSFLGTFMKKVDIANLFLNGARAFNSNNCKYKSAISLLQNLGIESEALLELLARSPRLLTASEGKVKESFQQAEDLGFKKGSKMFAVALRSIYGLNLDRRRQFLISLGFSENQTSDLCRRRPGLLRRREEKLKRNMDFAVNIVGLPLADLVKYPDLFLWNVETRIIPRYKVMKALKSMHGQVPKKKGVSFPRILMLTEERFLKKYVYSNAECSSLLLDIYHGRRES